MGEVYVGRKFRTVFSSDETSTYSGLHELMACGKRFAERGLAEGNAGTLAVRYGMRMVIATGGSELGKLDAGTFAEVVDYDPINDVVVAIGTAEPSSETPMCWMALRHRPEVHAIVHVHGPAPPEGRTLPDGLHATTEEAPYGTLELARSLLGGLRHAPDVYLAGHGYVSTAQTVHEAEVQLMRHLAALFPERFAHDPYAWPHDVRPGGNGA